MPYHKRKVWAIRHLNGVSLIAATNGPKACRKAEELLGASAGPYIVLKNQDQEIVYAKAMGAEVLGGPYLP